MAAALRAQQQTGRREGRDGEDDVLAPGSQHHVRQPTETFRPQREMAMSMEPPKRRSGRLGAGDAVQLPRRADDETLRMQNSRRFTRVGDPPAVKTVTSECRAQRYMLLLV